MKVSFHFFLPDRVRHQYYSITQALSNLDVHLVLVPTGSTSHVTFLTAVSEE